MKKKKMHLRDWLAWELWKDLKTLCGISASEDSENIAEDAKQEEERLKKIIEKEVKQGTKNMFSDKICLTCYHSYFSLVSQLKRAVKYRKERMKLLDESKAA